MRPKAHSRHCSQKEVGFAPHLHLECNLISNILSDAEQNSVDRFSVFLRKRTTFLNFQLHACCEIARFDVFEELPETDHCHILYIIAPWTILYTSSFSLLKRSVHSPEYHFAIWSWIRICRR